MNDKNITDKSIEYLAKCRFKGLKELSLTYTKITDKSIKYLIECDFQLHKLSFLNTEITEDAIDDLVKCNFKKIKVFWLHGTKIKNVSKLVLKYPNCSIYK